MRVVKRSGETEEFDPAKAINAILRAGLSQEDAERLMEEVRPRLYDGMSTEELYRIIRSRLPSCNASRYSLKKAILLMGPDGHSFETLVGRVFQELGYHVEVRQLLKGHCVTHEVDLVISKGSSKGMVECKYHNAPNYKSSIQEALYTYSRFLDLKDSHGFDAPWLVTNTKFSGDVVQYARCVGMRTICWKCTEEKGLERLVEKASVYPVTVLSLRKNEWRNLLDHDLVLCRDLIERKEEVRRLFPRETADRVIAKAAEFLECVKR